MRLPNLISTCIIAYLLLFSQSAIAQVDDHLAVRISAHMDFLMQVPSQDDAGFGLQTDAAFFASHKLRPLVSAHYEHLVGSKELVTPDIGRINKPGKIFGIQAGPEFAPTSWLSLSAQYGVFWHSISEVDFTAADGYRFAVSFLPGGKKSFVLQLSRVVIPRPVSNLRYHSVGIGWKMM